MLKRIAVYLLEKTMTEVVVFYILKH